MHIQAGFYTIVRCQELYQYRIDGGKVVSSMEKGVMTTCALIARGEIGLSQIELENVCIV
jgi:hypothetical protein